MKENNILHLTLKKEWFDKILSGEKKEEYREIKKHWIVRFCGAGSRTSNRFNTIYKFIPKQYEKIIFTNGYQKDAPKVEVEFKGIKIKDNIETPLGNGSFFVIELGKILKKENV